MPGARGRSSKSLKAFGRVMPDADDRAKRPVLVLGASGFIGARIVAALADSPIYRPIAASRRGELSLDATDRAALSNALKGIDYVVNCIAGSSRTMTVATQTLLDAARADPPVRIIHLSSMAIYGAATGTVNEDQPPVAPVSGYGEAKLACERLVLKYVNDGGDAVVLRPTCVFGPGSPQWTTRIGQLLQAGRLGDLGRAGDGFCNLAFIDDLVAGVVRALAAKNISGKAFNISSASGLTWNEFLIRFGKALGTTPIPRISPRSLRLESKLLAPAQRIMGMGLGRFGIRPGVAITPSLLSLMQQDIRIDCTRAITELSLPQTPAERMIASASASLVGNPLFAPDRVRLEAVGR
jgi:nucleoside-diphosphate-sugar epimerase